MTFVEDKSRLAVWAITPNGVVIARNMSEKIRNVDLFFSSNIDVQVKAEASGLDFRMFDRLKPELEEADLPFGHLGWFLSSQSTVLLTSIIVKFWTMAKGY